MNLLRYICKLSLRKQAATKIRYYIEVSYDAISSNTGILSLIPWQRKRIGLVGFKIVFFGINGCISLFTNSFINSTLSV